MQDNDIIIANADMYDKSKIMLYLDKINAERSRGINTDPLEEQLYNDLIDEKIKYTIEKKNNFLNLLNKDYNANTDIISSTLKNEGSDNIILQNQDKSILENENKIKKIKNDVLTIRRQLELNFNEYKKRSYIIFFLKNILIFLTLSLFIALLVKNNNLGKNTGKMLFSIIFIALVLIVIYNLYVNRNRDQALFKKIKYFDRIDMPEAVDPQ